MKTALKLLVTILVGLFLYLGFFAHRSAYDRNAAISYGIAAASYSPEAAEDLIRSEAKNRWPDNYEFRTEFIDAALAGYRTERKYH